MDFINFLPKFDKRFFKNIKDSKKLSASNRELWFESALEARKSGLLDFTVVLISEKVIDKKGISYAINLGIKKGLSTLNVSENHRIFLDGGLRVPERFKYQKCHCTQIENKDIMNHNSDYDYRCYHCQFNESHY